MKYLVVKNNKEEEELKEFFAPLAELYNKRKKLKKAEEAKARAEEQQKAIADAQEFRKHINEFIAMFENMNK